MDTISFGRPPELARWRGPGGTLGRRPAFPASPAYSSSGTDRTLYPATTVLPTGPGIRLKTTSGVYQTSGYADLTARQSMWFWFFAARKDPDTAPLVLWLNGALY
ncbi:unnamed protein product [Rhizoctonia solani]|uniref:Uncharacterized protein n=1 Tax=Rhizoctonia solani TaxID=456999 RepID=A0A8H3HFA8_9AGAM|nr:unnamed protein product [Rhizoctonia solani]